MSAVISETTSAAPGPTVVWGGASKGVIFSLLRERAGKPVEFVKCVSQPLEVPAHAEIVIEGYVDPNEHAPEGLLVYLDPAEASALEMARHVWRLRLAGWFERAAAVLVARTRAPTPQWTQANRR